MKKLLPLLFTVALFGAGCAVHVPLARSRSAASAAPAKKCPPGHLWSDGRCHAKGKGHDKAR